MRKVKLYEDFLSFLRYSQGNPNTYSSEPNYPSSSNTVTTSTPSSSGIEPSTMEPSSVREPGDIVITGGFTLPPGIPNKGDALHSFNRRKSDKWGGYMLSGPNDPEKKIPEKFKKYIKFDQGVGINESMKALKAKGIYPDIKSLIVNVVNSTTVKWEAVLGKSKDGTPWEGVSTVGSAGGSADSRALSQVEGMKRRNPKARTWELVLDLNITSPMKIRQFFYKYK